MATPSSASTSSFKQEADRVHERLLEASRREKEAVREIAYLLADVERRKLYAARNRTSTGDYAVHFGFTRSAGHARDLVNLVENLEKTPKIRAAFERGDMDWTKARTAALAAIAAAKDPTSEDRWLKYGLKHTNDVLEALAREEQGDPSPVRKRLVLSREEDADLEQACTMARAMYGRRLTDGQALAIVSRAWAQLQAGGGGGQGGRSSENPANRIVISRCGDCGKAWRETRRGRIEVSPAHAEAAACDAELSDVRDGPARITKTVPPMTRRHVLDRQGHRCRVPGCTSMGYLHVHHEGGREVVGHDPEKMPALCDVHHVQRHDDLLTIRPDAEVGFRFFGADGVELTGAPGELAAPAPRAPVVSGPRSCERPADPARSMSPAPGTSAAPEPVTADPRSCERRVAPADASSCASQSVAQQINDDAGRALTLLGLRARERDQALKSAREALAARDEPVTLEALLHAALVALPTPGARAL